MQRLQASPNLRMQAMFTGQQAPAEASIELLDHYTRTLTGVLLTQDTL